MMMKLHERPHVELISRPAIDMEALKRYLEQRDSSYVSFSSDAKTDGELLPEVGGRVCYQSWKNPRPGGNRAYLEHIKETGHGSVLEHSCYGFLISGVSRSLTHELVRHRHLSPSQLSQRYVDESAAEYVIPPLVLKHPDILAIWQEMIEQAHQNYLSLANLLVDKLPLSVTSELSATEKRKLVRQTARSILPNACETSLMMTGNVRAWRHFLYLRGSSQADTEIRTLAFAIYHLLVTEAPVLFDDFQVRHVKDVAELYTTYGDA